MPNNGRITLCPYYRNEKNLSISCEDTFRRFRWLSQKKRWLDTYCDSNWQYCPYAKDLNKLYEQMEGEDVENSKIMELRHRNEALEKELRKTVAMLGKLEKREKEKDEKLRQLRRERNSFESICIRTRQREKSLEKNLERAKTDFQKMGSIFESWIAYLISEFTDSKLNVEVVKEWAEKHEYRLKPFELRKDEKVGRKVVSVWEAVVRERVIDDETIQTTAGSGNDIEKRAEQDKA